MTLMERLAEAEEPKEVIPPPITCLYCGQAHTWSMDDTAPWAAACKECGCEDGHWDGCSYIAGIF